MVKRGILVKREMFSRFREGRSGRILFLTMGHGHSYFFSFLSPSGGRTSSLISFISSLVILVISSSFN